MVDSPLVESLAALSRFLVGDLTVKETLHQVSELTVEAIAAADVAGLTMLVEGRHRTAVFTDELAPVVDQSQYDTGEGPCVDAFDKRQVFRIDSTREDGPWPVFRETAAAHGIGSTLSLPMEAGDRAVGAMNLYSYAERAFDQDDADDAGRFAAHAAAVLVNARAYWEAHPLSSRLAEAFQHSAAIEQAKGILMSVQGCDEQAAFELLVRASQRENVKLRDIAARIVASTIKRGPTSHA